MRSYATRLTVDSIQPAYKYYSLLVSTLNQFHYDGPPLFLKLTKDCKTRHTTFFSFLNQSWCYAIQNKIIRWNNKKKGVRRQKCFSKIRKPILWIIFALFKMWPFNNQITSKVTWCVCVDTVRFKRKAYTLKRNNGICVVGKHLLKGLFVQIPMTSWHTFSNDE